MIETEFRKIEVVTGGDEICLRIEDKDSITGILNLCWLNATNTERLIWQLQQAKKKLEERAIILKAIMDTTDFSKLYNEFEERYNLYPVQMGRYEAFGKALKDGLIDKDTYDAARIHYGNLWHYVGD